MLALGQKQTPGSLEICVPGPKPPALPDPFIEKHADQGVQHFFTGHIRIAWCAANLFCVAIYEIRIVLRRPDITVEYLKIVW